MTAAVRVERLGKQYQIGTRDGIDASLRDLLTDFARAPVHRLKQLRRPSRDGWSAALNDVSFSMRRGEATAVIGRSGAGKSTLLRILSGLTQPSSGRVELRGRVASLLEVGTGFHPDLTGRENIHLYGAMLGISRADIRRHFEAIVEFAEVTGFVETPLKHYSHGMSMRLAFSIAVHLDGEILLVDEMLEGGDASFQQKCRRKMHELSGDGRTVLFISHNMHAVAAVCSRAIVLDRGERVFDGPAAEGIRFYLDHNLTDASLSWDVDACQRGGRDAGSVVRLSRIRATATDSGGFRFMEPLRFRIEITAHAALDRVACAMALDDVYGSRVVTFDSSDQQMGVAGGGRYAVDVTIPGFGLLPGKYLLSANVHSGSQCHDDLRHFGALTVASVSEDGAADVEEYTDRGGIVVASQWRFSQLSAQVLQ